MSLSQSGGGGSCWTQRTVSGVFRGTDSKQNGLGAGFHGPTARSRGRRVSHGSRLRCSVKFVFRLARMRLGCLAALRKLCRIRTYPSTGALFLAISTLQDHNAPNGIHSETVAAAAVLIMRTEGDAAGVGPLGAAAADAQHIQGSERGGAQHRREAAA